MADTIDSNASLVQRVEHKLREEREQREPLAGAWLTVLATVTLFAITIYVEWSNISLALSQLFPVLSDGTGEVDGAAILAFASVVGILSADVMLDRAADRWPDWVKRWVVRLGIVAVIIFTLAAMVLIPLSIWQANDPSATSGAGWLMQGSYVFFGLMLSALLPLGLLSGFALLQMLKPALAKIERTRAIDTKIAYAQQLLADREMALAARRDVEQQQTDGLSDEAIAERYAAEASATIGSVAGQIRHVISLREAANEANTEAAPVEASDVEWLNVLPLEKLRDMFTYLSSFTPADVRRRLKTQESAS